MTQRAMAHRPMREAVDGLSAPWAWSGLALALLLLGLPSLFDPFGRDQGIHAYIAFALNEGLLPYRDVYNVKAPLTTLVHWLSQSLFGHGMAPIRLMDLAIVGLTAAAVFVLGCRLFADRRAGFAAALTFLILYFAHGFWARAQTDGWMASATVCAVALACSVQTQSRWSTAFAVGAGLCASAAILFKVTGVLLAFAPLVALASHPNRRGPMLLAFMAGLVAGVGAMALVMIAMGTWAPFWEIQASLASYVARRAPLEAVMLRPLTALLDLAPVAILLAMSGFGWALWAAWARAPKMDRSQARALGLILIWLLAAMLSGVLQGKGFRYHFLPVLAPLSLLAGFGLTQICQSVPRRYAGIVLSGVLVAIGLTSDGVAQWRRAWPVISGQQDRQTYWQTGFSTADYSLPDNLRLATHLSETTGSEDRVLLWGYDPGVLYLARRLAATRFIFTLPLAAPDGPASFRAAFLDSVSATPPDLLILQHGDALPHVMGDTADSAARFEAWPELGSWRSDHYRFDQSVGQFDVYRLAPQDAASRSR